MIENETSFSKKIFIIDDNEQILELLEFTLSNAGFVVIKFEDGIISSKKIIFYLKETQPDLIILDIEMPEVTGIELLQEIRSDCDLSHIPVIILTGSDPARYKQIAFQLQVDDFITKPFEKDILLARINSLLARKEYLSNMSPLTNLPGNNTIKTEIVKRLEGNENFSLNYLDLKYFKAYNDYYGFDKGNHVIKYVAGLLRQMVLASNTINSRNFLGHIGGDDFLYIVSMDMSNIINSKIIKRFDSEIIKYYDHKELFQRGITTQDREGNLKKFPIMTVSIGSITVNNPSNHSYEDIVKLVTDNKNFSKVSKESNFFSNVLN